jgi:hypothetical protein
MRTLTIDTLNIDHNNLANKSKLSVHQDIAIQSQINDYILVLMLVGKLVIVIILSTKSTSIVPILAKPTTTLYLNTLLVALSWILLPCSRVNK